tara:strand:- start:5937 stop:6620 length:684 start_codon:yes stop_codon:yes gene_type:complete
MKNLLLVSLILLSFGCSNSNSQQDLKDLNISIYSDHKMLSNKDLVKEIFIGFSKDTNYDFSQISRNLYKNTWVYAFQAKKRWPNEYNIRVKEHQPLAKWGNEEFLTHSGVLVKPQVNRSNLDLVKLSGEESDKFLLLDISRYVQSQLNRYSDTVKEINLSSGGNLRVLTESGSELIFTKKDFREQLERLEDFISFELFSGKLNHIKYMDFRYKNGISVLLKQGEMYE